MFQQLRGIKTSEAKSHQVRQIIITIIITVNISRGFTTCFYIDYLI